MTKTVNSRTTTCAATAINKVERLRDLGFEESTAEEGNKTAQAYARKPAFRNPKA